MTFRVEIQVSERDIADLIETGLQGSSYWCANFDVTIPEDASPDVRFPYLPLMDGGSLQFYLHEEYNSRICWNLRRSSVERGLRILAKDFPSHWADFVNENFDEFTGQLFIQLCLFGEEVFC